MALNGIPRDPSQRSGAHFHNHPLPRDGSENQVTFEDSRTGQNQARLRAPPDDPRGLVDVQRARRFPLASDNDLEQAHNRPPITAPTGCAEAR